MLQPIQIIDKPQQTEIPAIPRTCEACGTIVPEGDKAINFIPAVGSAGHPDVAGVVTCPYEEHWACSLECWAKVAHACIDEHMAQILQHIHQKMGIGGNKYVSTDNNIA